MQPREVLRAVVGYQDAKARSKRLLVVLTIVVSLLIFMLLGNFGYDDAKIRRHCANARIVAAERV